MKQKRHYYLSAMLLFALTFALSGVPVRAARLVNVSSYATKSITFSQDLTGDGKKDKIKITPSKKDGPYYNKLQISVNGKKALTISSKYLFYSFRAQYFSMSKSKNFLQLSCLSDNDWRTVNAIYRYDNKTKKLVKALDLVTNIQSGKDVIKVSGSQIQIRHSCQPPETGRVYWDYTYTYKNGKFKLKSNTARVYSALTGYDKGDGYSKYFKKHQLKVANSFPLYQNTNLSQKAFDTKRGDVLTLYKVKVSGKSIYIQFKKGSKTGWQKVCRDKSVYDYSSKAPEKTGWFYGVLYRLAG